MQNQNTANQMRLEMGRSEFGGNFNNMDFFWYRAPSFVINSTLPAVTNNIQIDASADFLWIATTYQASIVADGVVLGATRRSRWRRSPAMGKIRTVWSSRAFSAKTRRLV